MSWPVVMNKKHYSPICLVYGRPIPLLLPGFVRLVFPVFMKISGLRKKTGVDRVWRPWKFGRKKEERRGRRAVLTQAFPGFYSSVDPAVLSFVSAVKTRYCCKHIYEYKTVCFIRFLLFKHVFIHFRSPKPQRPWTGKSESAGGNIPL